MAPQYYSQVAADIERSVFAIYAALEEMDLLRQGTMIRVRAFIPLPADESDFPNTVTMKAIRLGKAHSECNRIAIGHIHYDPDWWEWGDGE